MPAGDPVFVVIAFGAVVGALLTVVGVIKTVRYQGWGKQTWAPTAKPWLASAAAILALTLIGGIVWATSS